MRLCVREGGGCVWVSGGGGASCCSGVVVVRLSVPGMYVWVFGGWGGASRCSGEVRLGVRGEGRCFRGLNGGGGGGA